MGDLRTLHCQVLPRLSAESWPRINGNLETTTPTSNTNSNLGKPQILCLEALSAAKLDGIRRDLHGQGEKYEEQKAS